MCLFVSELARNCTENHSIGSLPAATHVQHHKLTTGTHNNITMTEIKWNCVPKIQCVVPNCRNLLQEWMAPFPKDVVLQYRWKECIEIGSGERLPALTTLAKDGFVCNMHFLGFQSDDPDCYRQPSLFFQQGVVFEVHSCSLCCRVHLKEDMLEKGDHIRGNHTVEGIIKTYFGAKYFNHHADAEYVCEECVVKVDIIFKFDRQLESARRELKQLLRKMSFERINFQKNDYGTVPAVENGAGDTMFVETTYEEILEEDIIEEMMVGSEYAEHPVVEHPSRKTSLLQIEPHLASQPESADEFSLEKEPSFGGKPGLENKPSSESKPLQKRVPKNKTLDSATRGKLNKSRLKCYMCNIYLESSAFLLSHLMLNHKDREALHCQECDVRFSRSPEYNAHLAKHDAELRPFKCDYCPLRFLKESSKTKHHHDYHDENTKNRVKVIKPRPKNFMCATCGRSYHSQAELDRHDKVQHKGEIVLTCDICHKPFASRRNLKRHLLIHLDERPYVCNHCGVSYRQSQALLDHVNENHTEQSNAKYQCTNCNKQFRSLRQLTSHRKKYVTQPALANRSGGESNNMISCKVCDMLFPKGLEILEHFKSVHPDKNLEHYPCSACGEIFFSRTTLTSHSYRHSDKFACSQCGRKHYTKLALDVHLYKFHSTTVGDHIFRKCEQCDKECLRGTDYLRHVKTHTAAQYSCEICEKTFMERFQLRNHLRKHSGEKPLRCPFCSARFGDPTLLCKHKKQCKPVLFNMQGTD